MGRTVTESEAVIIPPHNEMELNEKPHWFSHRIPQEIIDLEYFWGDIQTLDNYDRFFYS